MPTRSRINRQSVSHPSIRARVACRVSHHPRLVSTMSVGIIVASSRRRVVASSRRRVAPKSVQAPPWRITIRSNKTSHRVLRGVAQWRHMCHMFSQPIALWVIHSIASARRAFEDDDDTDGDVSRDASQVTREFSRVRDDRGRCATRRRRRTTETTREDDG